VNTIALPFPAGISAPPGRSLGTTGTQQYLTQVVQSITEANPSDHTEGYVQQWNLDVQRELPAGFFVSAAYVGSKGTHLAQYSQQIDQISDTLLAQAALQVNPSLPNPRQNVTLVQPTPNPFFVNGQALALTGPTTTIGQLPSVPAVHQLAACRPGVVRQHLPLVPAHGAEALCGGWFVVGCLHQREAHQRHGHADGLAGAGRGRDSRQ